MFLFAAAPASAIQYLGTTQFTCADFTAAGTGAAILDRDNTGTGSEQVRIDVKDGNGVLLFTLTFTNTLGSYSGGLINTSLFTTPPTANPLVMTATSLAGNGLPAVVGVVQSGQCGTLATIPTVSTAGLIAMAGLIAAAAIFLLVRR
jgi:hypothetical protein